VRKPRRRSSSALEELGADANDALFVGDRRVDDVEGASAVGIATVQALWFRVDEAEGVEPDFTAFTPVDVLSVVRRLAGGH
jgi:FMN phosphatase YigB (HAD superfamily)